MSITFVGDDFSSSISSIGMYSDSTTMVKTNDFAEILKRADTVVLRPNTIPEFIAGLSVVDSVRESGGDITKLILPYIPGARQDRVNPTGDVGFMLQTVARIINAYNFEEVRVVDPHSPEALALINNSEALPYTMLYSHLWKGYSGVIAPDKGGRFRAKFAFDVLFPSYDPINPNRREYIEASKIRDVSTGRLSGFDVTVKKGAHYIVVDDICDGGGTFIGLGEKIREQGAFADLFVTHGIFSKGTGELKKLYKTIYTTNTRDINSRNDVMVFDILSEMRDF